jgi:hypothetical protein
MTNVVSTSSIDAVIARAEEFMSLGLIKASRSGLEPKRAGRGRNCGNGVAFEWLCKEVSNTEKKCNFWPFSKNNGFPASVAYRGKIYKPGRLMCLLANGPPPTSAHLASYTCGRGKNGCIHPKHLAWKTRSESRFNEFKNGRRKSYGKGGKLTPTEAAQIRSLGDTKLTSELGRMYGLSPQRVTEILKGKAYKPKQFSPSAQNGRSYPKLAVARRTYSLGGYASSALALAAYEAARIRARLGEPIVPLAKMKPSADDLRRWYRAPQEIKFGDREGEIVAAVEPDQEQSMFIMHRALNDLHPNVRKFVLVASDTGDLTEAAEAAGLNQAQVAMLLPRLRAFLRSELPPIGPKGKPQQAAAGDTRLKAKAVN